jgi:WD40 repeat protein
MSLTLDEKYALLYMSHGFRLKAIPLSDYVDRRQGIRLGRRKRPERMPLDVVSFGDLGPMASAEDGTLFAPSGLSASGIDDIITSADSASAFLALRSGDIVQLEIGTSTESRRFSGHSGPVRLIRLVSGGRQLVSISDDATIRVWDLATGRNVSVVPGLAGVTHGKLSSDRPYLYVSSADLSLRVYDIATGRSVASFVGEGPIAHFDVSLDGSRVIIGETSGRIHILRLMHS